MDAIASGGMATVWRALDTRLDRQVALKRPHPGHGDHTWRERLEREARLAAGISHPNLVTVFDTGSDDEGPYLVMELVEGPTLADDLPALSTAEITTMGSQLASALAAVHAAGIVHRDIKPANIILGSDGPLLTDFGIARRPDASDRLTTEGVVITTPSYAPPEVLEGGDPTPPADVFSLGAVLYELLSQSPAFRGTDRTPPSALADPVLDNVIRATLDPDPSRRPQAAELAGVLKSGAPTVEMGAGRHERATPHTTAPLTPEPTPSAAGASLDSGRRRWLTPLLAVVTLVALGSLVVMALQDPTPTTGTTEPNPATSVTAPSSTATASSTTTAPTSVTSTTGATTTTQLTTTTTPPSTTTNTGEPALTELEELRALVDGLGPPELRPKEEERIVGALDEIEQIVVSGFEGGEDDDEDDEDEDGDDRKDLDKALDDIQKSADQIRDTDIADEVLVALDDLRKAIDALRNGGDD